MSTPSVISENSRLRSSKCRPLNVSDRNSFLKINEKTTDRLITRVSAPIRQSNAESSPESDGQFDASVAPPFTLSDIRNAIPKNCWKKSTLKSMSYLIADVIIVLGLAAGAAYLNSWAVWPLYWIAQGTMFWALFVIGHDWCVGLFPLDHPICFLTPLSHFPVAMGAFQIAELSMILLGI